MQVCCSKLRSEICLPLEISPQSQCIFVCWHIMEHGKDAEEPGISASNPVSRLVWKMGGRPTSVTVINALNDLGP